MARKFDVSEIMSQVRVWDLDVELQLTRGLKQMNKERKVKTCNNRAGVFRARHVPILLTYSQWNACEWEVLATLETGMR